VWLCVGQIYIYPSLQTLMYHSDQISCYITELEEDRNTGGGEALRMQHQACLFVSKTWKENLVINVNVADSSHNAAGLYSPIAISRHYVENRLQSLRADSSAGGTTELSGTSSHRARVVVLPATDRPKTLCFKE